jgi:cytochrome c oxidase subunit 3
MSSSQTHDSYYVPHSSIWPFIAAFTLFVLLVGASKWLNGDGSGSTLFLLGFIGVVGMMYGWFSAVVRESESGMYNQQVDLSFRWSMGWFIFSEVMFFGAFFGALFYARVLSVPWLAGEAASNYETHAVLWPAFEAAWPTNGPGDIGGAFSYMSAWGLPAINTLILLTSGVTVTWAHWGLKENDRKKLTLGLAATVALGFLFLGIQAYEYGHAYSDLNLTLGSGIYGTTFFMLTGFHGAHVTIGAIMLAIILLRVLKGHFTPEHHFGFEAAAWYWHFVDVVWLGLFIFVYWL